MGSCHNWSHLYYIYLIIFILSSPPERLPLMLFSLYGTKKDQKSHFLNEKILKYSCYQEYIGEEQFALFS